MSYLPTLLQEVLQGASKRGSPSQLLENAHDLMVTKVDLDGCPSCANLEPAEANMASQPFNTRPLILSTDTSSAVISSENTVDHTVEITKSRFRQAPSCLEQSEQTEHSTNGNVEYGPDIDSKGLHEEHALSQPFDTFSDSLTDRNTKFSYETAETMVSPTENGVFLNNNVLDGERKALGLHMSIKVGETFKAFEESFADFPQQQLPIQESGVAVVVSTDLGGWQRFDTEEYEGNKVFGCDQANDGEALQKRELWEQLLEEGSEDSETHFRMSTSQIEGETDVNSALHGGNQFWWASPGNPFIEGVDRLSNFSEADHCSANDFIAKSQLSDGFEADTGLPFTQGPFHTDDGNGNFLQEKLVEGNLGSQSNGLYDNGNSRHAKPRFPSFSDIRQSSSKSRDPSFVSFMERVPAFQPANCVNGIGNGGEKWEANFDSVVPTTQEGPRSLSLPREAGDTQWQREKQTSSLFSQEAPVMSHSKPSGFSSSKLSPMVKKVVNKVRTTPEGAVSAVHPGKSSNAQDKKESKKWTWRHCICCSHARDVNTTGTRGQE